VSNSRDVLGRELIEHQNLNVSKFNLDVAAFAPGIYFITTNEAITSKVVVKKP